jgi:hypothetical protein
MDNKIERIKDHVAHAISNTVTESMPMLQKKFKASGAEVSVAIVRALTLLACATTAGIALGPDVTDAQMQDLISELRGRIEPILVECGSAAREKPGV